MIDRRKFLLGAMGIGIAATFPTSASASAVDLLEAELASGRACGENAAAIRGTLSRLRSSRPPGAGRTVVVDIPSQHLGAYEDGYLQMESRVVVGDADWRTPDLDTRVTFVRFNPTWTVPESILRARSWRDRLAEDPGYFSRLDFMISLDGRMVSPDEAAVSASRTGSFVQQPGPGNALGRVKLGLAQGDAIYLHDTNDHSAFGESQRTLSHGCIRVERAVELAAWALGISEYDAQAMIDGDDRRDHRDIPSPVRVVTTYFTAWPDENGQILYYPDPYGKDSGSGDCGYEAPKTEAWGSSDGGSVEEAWPDEVVIYAN